MKKTNRKTYIKISVIILWIAIWQIMYMALDSSLLLVSPLTVLKKISELVVTAEFWLTILNSLVRIMLGFLLGVLVGAAVAVISSVSPVLHEFFSIPLGIIKATPVASFIILALIWITGKNLSVFISFLMVMPIVWSNVYEGISKTAPNLIQMAHMFKLKKSSIVRNIYVPSVLPFFMSAIKVALGFAWKAGISGEIIAIPNGTIGTELYDAKIYLQTADLFAWTAVVIVLSFIIENLLVKGINRVMNSGKMRGLK